MNYLILPRLGKKSIIALAALAGFLLVQSQAMADMKTITVLPFESHASSDISYLSAGFVQMLSSRLAWQDKVAVVPPAGEIQSLILSRKATGRSLADQAGKAMGSDYVLFGSITEFAGTYSLDASVLHVASGQIKAFPGMAEDKNGVIPELNLIAARINMSLFGRKTANVDLTAEKTLTPETYSRRANPETLMPEKYWKTKKRKGKRFWEVWKTDPFDVETGPEDDRPFWKVWETSSTGRDSTGVEDKPIWKFWGDDAPDDSDDLDMEEKKTRPFWKFWEDDEDVRNPDGSTREKPFWKFWDSDDEEHVETIE